MYCNNVCIICKSGKCIRAYGHEDNGCVHVTAAGEKHTWKSLPATDSTNAPKPFIPPLEPQQANAEVVPAVEVKTEPIKVEETEAERLQREAKELMAKVEKIGK